MIYFISDPHFGHPAAVMRSEYPFGSVEERDETLIENWNRRVQPDDTVYLLGDLLCKSEKRPEEYLQRLTGNKVLIIGNHDHAWLEQVDLGAYFSEVTQYQEMKLEEKVVTLCHYPLLEWRNSRRLGSHEYGFLIHGHTHQRRSELYAPLFSMPNALNAGVDVNGYQPVSFEELRVNNERFKLSAISDPVEQAKFLCRSRHSHCCDRGGTLYALHPIHVAEQFDETQHKIVALLHDTLEDTELPPELIRETFGDRVLEAVTTLTHKNGESYFSYIERIKRDPLARDVKREDLKHNMDLSRLKRVHDSDLARVEKYRQALAMLET